MTMQLDVEEFSLASRQQALARGCADCGGDLARGFAAKKGSDDELVCLCCDWFLGMEAAGWVTEPDG